MIPGHRIMADGPNHITEQRKLAKLVLTNVD